MPGSLAASAVPMGSGPAGEGNVCIGVGCDLVLCRPRARINSANSGLRRRDRAEAGAEGDRRKRPIYRQLDSVSSSNVVPPPQGRARACAYVAAVPHDAESALRAVALRAWVPCGAFRHACGGTHGIALAGSQRLAPRHTPTFAATAPGRPVTLLTA